MDRGRKAQPCANKHLRDVEVCTSAGRGGQMTRVHAALPTCLRSRIPSPAPLQTRTQHQAHMQRIRNMRPSIDNKPPNTRAQSNTKRLVVLEGELRAPWVVRGDDEDAGGGPQTVAPHPRRAAPYPCLRPASSRSQSGTRASSATTGCCWGA